MFVRVKTTPNSPRKSIQICQNFREGKKVKQKIIRYVGVAQNEWEEQKLKDYAAEIIAQITIEREKNAKQLALLDISKAEALKHTHSKAGRHRRKNIEDILPPSQVTLDDITEESRIVEGVHDIAGKMFDDMYLPLFKSKRIYSLLKNVVLSRL